MPPSRMPVTMNALEVRIAVLAAILAAIVMRPVRCRRNLKDLGRELATGSQTLLSRLTVALPSSPPPQG